jgi:hypothetical protein
LLKKCRLAFRLVQSGTPKHPAGSLASPVTSDGIANDMKTIRFFAVAGITTFGGRHRVKLLPVGLPLFRPGVGRHFCYRSFG